MATRINRRHFLQLAALSVGAVTAGAGRISGSPGEFRRWKLGRVATTQISLYSEPLDTSQILRQLYRDELFNIYQSVTPPTGPAWNPLWYRIWGGYVHSKHVQVVKFTKNNASVAIRPEGQLAEVTVPYTQSQRFSRYDGWSPLYRLYYGTTHWVTGLTFGPDGLDWYELTDELGNTKYFAPAEHLRYLADEELAPINPDIDAADKRIEVELSRQTLTAFENDVPVLHTRISSGIHSNVPAGAIPTETPTGRFNISVKMPSKHMGEGRLTDNLEDYELVGVPWTAFFHPDGYAIHGTYWHNNYGVQMSRGCVNMRSEEAKWLFRWMTPMNGPADIDKTGYGTQLDIF
jgi:lipoprotein-anchoring transpeptidase ErfK/SrfK